VRADVCYADQRLAAWASWVRSKLAAWPSRTLLGRIIEEGASGAAQGRPLETLPDIVLQTDRAVARIEPCLSQVLRVYYLVHASSEVKAEACHCSRATFWRRVERGQIAVYIHLQKGETLGYISGSSLPNSL